MGESRFKPGWKFSGKEVRSRSAVTARILGLPYPDEVGLQDAYDQSDVLPFRRSHPPARSVEHLQRSNTRTPVHLYQRIRMIV